MSMCRSTDQPKSTTCSTQRSKTSSFTLPRGRSSKLKRTPRIPQSCNLCNSLSVFCRRYAQPRESALVILRWHPALPNYLDRGRSAARRRHAPCRLSPSFSDNAQAAPRAACIRASIEKGMSREGRRHENVCRMILAGERSWASACWDPGDNNRA